MRKYTNSERYKMLASAAVCILLVGVLIGFAIIFLIVGPSVESEIKEQKETIKHQYQIISDLKEQQGWCYE